MADRTGLQLTDAELESQLCTWAGRLAAATAEFLRLLAEFDRREAWAGPGIRSCAHWLSWRCGMGLQAARDHVRVARRLQPLPITTDAFAAGRLSYTKVRAICRVATPATENDLVDVALCSTAAQVERVTRTLPTITPETVPAAAGPSREPAQPRLHWQTDSETGRTRLFGWLEAEDAALVLSVLRAAADERARVEPVGASGTSPTDSSRTAVAGSFAAAVVVDAFTAAAQGLEHIATAAAADGAAVHPPPVQVEVHVDADLLTRMRSEADRGTSRCHVQDGAAVPLAVVERLACDGAVRLTTHGSDGRTLDVGRRRRRPSSRQAQALVRRDGGCTVPGCERTRFLHAHHVVFWSRGGPTALDNLVMLCGDHHRALHDGVFAIDALGRQRFRFRDGAGTAITYAPRTRGAARDLAADVSAYAVIDGATLTPDWYGDRLTRYGLDVIAETYVRNRAAEMAADPWARAA
ncbi:MAG: endonuclease [Nocardioidaceae bacterium]|jgi:hypothetical protein|nr:endonuclease [Nocardioidaceae bacterium]